MGGGVELTVCHGRFFGFAEKPMVYPHLDLHMVSLIAGLWLIVSHGLALFCPGPVQGWLRKFPRSKPMGFFLLLVDSIWALALMATMDLGEFTYMRTAILVVILAATYLTFRYVDEFLAVRTLGILMLLAAEPLIEAAFLQPGEGRLLLVVFAYALAVVGMFWVGLPYLMRDFVEFCRKSKAIWNAAALAGVVYGGVLAAYGLMR